MEIKLKEIIHSDNLDYLKKADKEFIDLIYIDPPFFTQKDWGEFDDRWDSMDHYINYLKERVVLMRDTLKPTGSFYLHCDPTASHYIKIMLDYVFGQKNFRNEIVWCYFTGKYPGSDFARKHDIIFRYTKTDNFKFNIVDGVHKNGLQASSVAQYNKIDNDGRKYRDIKGKRYYSDNYKNQPMEDYWTDIPILKRNFAETLGYPTQKPLALLERIIKASSNKGDIVADFYAGCGTTLEAADKLERKWIGVEENGNAIELIKKRLCQEQ